MLVWMTWRRAAQVLGTPEDRLRQIAYLEQWNYNLVGVEVRIGNLGETVRRLAA